MVKKQLAAEKSGNWGELQAWKDNSMLVDIQSFRRILSLRINSPSSSDVLESRNGAEKSSAVIRSNKESVLNAVNSLEGRNDIIYVGPNFTHESQRVPNDPQYTGGNQWAIDHIGLPDAWDITTGSADVRVGVIDTGIHGNHQDLVNRLNNNLHRDFRNATTGDVPTPFDTDEHGTHVAGIIGAETNVTPARGMAGAAWNSSLVCLIISENGSWFVDNAILAVDHATANNIQILNYSGRVRNRNNVVNINDPVFEQAIRAYPGLFVTAAGNTGTTGNNNDTNPQFPANYARTLNNVISVGATNNADQRANFSHYGVNTVSIYAPGVNIRSSIPGTATYASWDGTSMASPYVAGVAALIRSILPNITAAQLREFILNNADPITINTPIGNQNVLRLNAGEAVKNATFVTSNGGNTITVRQEAVLRDVIIPSQINGITITTIGNSAFANQTQLSQITIPASVTYLGANAFAGCSNLTITVQRASIPASWENWNPNNRTVILTIPGGCLHNFQYQSINGSQHRKLCSICGDYADFAHPLSYQSLNGANHRAECAVCGYSASIGHTISYSPIYDESHTSMTHRKRCILCSYEAIGRHIYVNNSIVCCVIGEIMKMPYGITGDPFIGLIEENMAERDSYISSYVSTVAAAPRDASCQTEHDHLSCSHAHAA